MRHLLALLVPMALPLFAASIKGGALTGQGHELLKSHANDKQRQGQKRPQPAKQQQGIRAVL